MFIESWLSRHVSSELQLFPGTEGCLSMKTDAKHALCATLAPLGAV